MDSRRFSFTRSDVGRRSGVVRDAVGEGVSNRPRIMGEAIEEDDDLGVFRRPVERMVGFDEESGFIEVVELL